MGNGQWGIPTDQKALPEAGWQEYIQWCLRRRRRFVVRENSMVPTVIPGDTVLAEMGVSVQVGDIAIFRWKDVGNGQVFPGQNVSLRNTGNVSDMLLIKRVSEIFYGGGVYLISDNADEPTARDSRHFGVIDIDDIIGRVTSRLASVQ